MRRAPLLVLVATPGGCGPVWMFPGGRLSGIESAIPPLAATKRKYDWKPEPEQRRNALLFRLEPR